MEAITVLDGWEETGGGPPGPPGPDASTPILTSIPTPPNTAEIVLNDNGYVLVRVRNPSGVVIDSFVWPPWRIWRIDITI